MYCILFQFLENFNDIIAHFRILTFIIYINLQNMYLYILKQNKKHVTE